MTISTKPDDIDNPEVLLYYMESHPHSGENRAAAKLLRKLLAATPLVAATDNPYHMKALLDLAIARMNRARRILTNDNPRPECNWGMLDTADLVALAGQVAPQATVEHMENIHELAKRLQSKAYNHGNADAGSHYSDNYYRAIAAESDEALGALINACKAIATPPTSKATELTKAAKPECEDCNDTGRMFIGNSGLESDGNAPEFERCGSCGYGEATSKADTSETGIRNAVLEEAAVAIWQFRSAENISSALMQNISLVCALVRALKSATPSTIKAEPTGEQL